MTLKILICLLLSLPVGATVFEVQTIEQQIKESDAVMVGHFLKSKSIKLDDGSIATQMIFKMDKEFGLQSDLYQMDEVIIHFPGGTIGDQTTKVDGTPSFISGESVALMIKTVSDRYWGLNLGMGSFKIINYGNEKLIINSIFPSDRKISQIKLEDFEKSIKKIKGTGLKEVVVSNDFMEASTRERNRVPASVKEGKNRSLASKPDQQEDREEPRSLNTSWLVLLLAFMGVVFKLSRSKEVK